jgi:uridine kinase
MTETAVVRCTGVCADHVKRGTASYDHYYRTVADWTCEYGRWVAGGSRPDQFISITRLVNDLRSLRDGRTVVSPATDRVIEPAPWIILEEPWGRQRSEISSLIDAVVHIDVPLDISLARRIVRDAQRGYDPIEFLRAHLTEPLHEIYLQQQRGAESADVIVDGRRPVTETLAATVLHLQTARKMIDRPEC